MLSMVRLSLSLIATAGFDHGSVSNGFAAGTFSTTSAQLDALYPDLYQAYDAQTATPNLMGGAYFGVRGGGSQAWLQGAAVSSAQYVNQGTVFETLQTAAGGLSAETYLFAPDNVAAPTVFLMLHLVNNTSAAIADNGAFFFVYPLVGSGSAQLSTETFSYATNDSFLMTGASGSLTVQTLSPSTHHAQTPTDVAGTVTSGGSLPDTGGPNTQDDAAAGFQWTLPSLAPGQDAWVGVALASGDPTAMQSAIAGQTPQALILAQEQRDAAIVSAITLPIGLSTTETEVALQQLSILRMAEVREPNTNGATPFGGILASLAPGEWTITWVRDSDYAIVALARSGRIQEALEALEFLLNAKVGNYASDLNGVSYGVSVCRHYGDGEEWSDSNQDGPNIEIDGFGLTLWATGEVLRAGGAQAATALAPYADRLLNQLASPLVELVDGSGLLTPDSSIWEFHWDGQQRHFAFTDAAAVAGLSAVPAIAAALSQPVPANVPRAARQLALVMQATLMDPVGAIPGTLEGAGGADDDRDAAAIEAYGLAGLNPTATLAAIQSDLMVASGLGYRRNNQGSSYDNAEWAFIDLRVAAAEFGMGQAADGEKLLDRVTSAASNAYDLIPELYDPQTGAYSGAIPMVGFGAAAYLLALEARAQGLVPPTDWADAGAESPDAGTIADAGVAVDGGPGLDAGQAIDAGASPLDAGGDAGVLAPDGGYFASHVDGGTAAPTADAGGEALAGRSGCGQSGGAAWLALALLPALCRGRRRSRARA